MKRTSLIALFLALAALPALVQEPGAPRPFVGAGNTAPRPGNFVELVEAFYDFAAGNLRTSFARRTFADSTPFITAIFDSAVHPESRLPVFEDRLQYDASEGAIPVHMNPDLDRNTAKVDLALRSVAGFTVTGGGVWSTTKNQYTGLATDYAGFTLRAARQIAGGGCDGAAGRTRSVATTSLSTRPSGWASRDPPPRRRR